MKALLPALLLSLSTLAAAPASASQITIDFEHTPGADGVLGTADDVAVTNTSMQPLGDQFAALGLTFTRGTLFQSSFYDGNPANHFISSTAPVAVLANGVTGISIDSYSYWNATLIGYDINGNAIGSTQLVNPDAGSGPLKGTLALTGAQAFYGFSVVADMPSHILNLDNLVLTSADQVSDVPEPSAAALLGIGLLAGSLSLRTRNGKRG